MRLVVHTLLLLASFTLVAAHAGAEGATARVRMETFSRGLHAVTAHFVQSVTDAGGRRGEESSGTLALEAPRQFRWQTTAPYQQTIVADGTRVWVYEPDLEQVSVRSQSSEEAQSPLTVLTDLSQLDGEFTTSEAGRRDDLDWLKLVSRQAEPEFEYAELGFDADGLREMRFKDQLGNVTTIRFSDWQRNPRLPPGTFSFTPPEGVDVVGDLAPGAEVFPVHD